MKPHLSPFLLTLLNILSFSCCTTPTEKHVPANGIYYWRTTFRPTADERTFVREHHIGRIYLHMYDVDMVGYATKNIEPIATLQFQDSLIAGIEYVPTIYITQNAIRSLEGQEKAIAEKVVTRTLNMVDWHEIPNVQEVQIDGDWQTSTQRSYFLFCKELRKLLHVRGLRLSATIRLSQLREKVPPVDRGVLMLYNTGSVQNAATKNSILDIETCKAYLSRRAIPEYALPLDYALPTFGWAAVYDEDGNFQRLSYLQDYPEPSFERIDSTHYRACYYETYQDALYYHGDIIRIENTPYSLLQEVKSLLPISEQNSIILYHLDSRQTQRYSYEEIDSIFAR